MSTDVLQDLLQERSHLKEERRDPVAGLQSGPSPVVRTEISVAYIMSRFPKITETFILFEILGVEKQGVRVELFPLLKVRETAIHPEGASIWKKLLERFSQNKGEVLMHPEAEQLVRRAHYLPFFSWPILKAQFHYFFKKPGTFLKTLWTLVLSNWGSNNYLFGAISIFPKTAYMAYRMEKSSVQHVHAHFANHPAAAAYIVHQLTGIPYSFTAHGADLQVDQHMLLEKVREASFVVAISRYNKSFILDKCGQQYQDKIDVIRCGVDTEHFSPGPISLKKEGFLSVLCIGTLYEVKGHTYLIEACRLLKEKGIRFRCDLVGDGPFRQSLQEQVARSGLEGWVVFHGQQTRQRISEFLQGADVLVVPSIPTESGRREGIPVVLMEAMSSAVPVVASGISGIPELVQDGVSGILVPPRDPLALAAALEHLYLHPDLGHQLGWAGREKVLEEFDLEKNTAALAAHFRRVRS